MLLKIKKATLNPLFIINSEKPIIKQKAKELFPELIYKLKNCIKKIN